MIMILILTEAIVMAMGSAVKQEIYIFQLSETTAM